MAELAEETADIIFAALDHGIESVREGGPLVPFVIRESNGERRLARFVHETLEGGIAQAVVFIKSEPLAEGERAALVYDGYLTAPDGVRLDAIYAECVEADGAVTVMAQRYKPKKMLRRFEVVGSPALLPGGQYL